MFLPTLKQSARSSGGKGAGDHAAVLAFVLAHEHVKSFHAVYPEPKTGKLYCDLIVDHSLKDWDGLRSEFTGYILTRFP